MKGSDIESHLKLLAGIQRPRRDLWPGIEDEIAGWTAARRLQKPRQPLMPSLAVAAAAIALAVLGLLTVPRMLASREDGSWARTAGSAEVLDERSLRLLLQDLETAQNEYEYAKSSLVASLRRIGRLYGEDEVRLVEQSFVAIDATIEDLRSSVRRSPESLEHVYRLASLFGQQAQALSEADQIIQNAYQ